MTLASALADLPLGDELRAWIRTHEHFADAWESCPRGDWLIALALFGGAERRIVVEAARRAVALAVSRQPTPDAERALASAAAWVERTRGAPDCWAAGFAASSDSSRRTDQAQADVSMAAACVAFACDDAADETYYAARGHAAEAAHLAARSFGPRARHAHLAIAILVRELVSAAEVEGGLSRATASPWTLPDDGDSEIFDYPYLAYSHSVVG